MRRRGGHGLSAQRGRGGIGLTLTPFLTLFLPPPLVLATLGQLLLASDPISLRLYWNALNARLPRRAFALALLGFAFASALRLLLS